MEAIRICENCGLPSWAVSGSGRFIQIKMKPDSQYQRARMQTVWCHNDSCAIQCLAVALHGAATHKWPVTLKQFAATNPLAVLPAVLRSRGRVSAHATIKARLEQPKQAEFEEIY